MPAVTTAVVINSFNQYYITNRNIVRCGRVFGFCGSAATKAFRPQAPGDQ